MTIYEQINDLRLEAEANLTLYVNGQDDYAINRYHQIMDAILVLESQLNQN